MYLSELRKGFNHSMILPDLGWWIGRELGSKLPALVDWHSTIWANQAT